MGITATFALACAGAAGAVAIAANIYHRVKTRKERPEGKTFTEKALAFASTTFILMPFCTVVCMWDSIWAIAWPEQKWERLKGLDLLPLILFVSVVSLVAIFKPMCLVTGIIVHTAISLGMALSLWDGIYLETLQKSTSPEDKDSLAT